jgi:hypothetical protein
MNRGFSPGGKSNLTKSGQSEDLLIANDESLYAELFGALASLLRSYTAVHGLHEGIEAAIEFDPQRIVARNGERWLQLERRNKVVTWMRENGTSGELELTEHGRLRSDEGEEEMDMAAEAWARELMTGDTTR